MKTRRMAIMLLIMVCWIAWTFEAPAASYDPLVEQVQKQLRELGYDPGPVDGKMGQKTANAIKSFQQDNGLLITGEYNEATLKKLGIATTEEQPAPIQATPTPQPQPTPTPKPKPQREQKAKDPPKINLGTFDCTVENGLTDEMVAQIQKHLSENKSADRLSLKNGSNDDLKKLPALSEVLFELALSKSEDITDLSPLATLTNLERLELESLNYLTDLTPVEKLEGLKYLGLRELGVPLNLEPVAKLTLLEQLWIGDKVHIQNFEFLQPLNNLETLSIYKSKLDPQDPSDISALAGKTKLKTLKFEGVNIQDISSIKDSVALTTLRLANIPLEDLTPLKEISSLKYLELLKTPVKDLSPLQTLTNLRNLTLYYTEVTDLTPLTALKNNLRYLNLNGIKARDMTPIGELAELTDIILDETEFSDYSPLAKCTKLEFLQARSEKSGFDKLDVITSMPNLKRVWLDRNTKITQWEVLAHTTSLEDLSLGKSSFSDLKLLENLVNLQTLNIYECTVKNPEAIARLPRLKRLSLMRTKGIDDISIFKNLAQIGDFSLTQASNQFPQEQWDILNQAKEADKKLRKIFEDAFKNNSNKWLESDDENCTLKVEADKYVFHHKRDQGYWMTWQPIDMDFQQDFLIAVTMTKVDGVDNVGYGVAWGIKDVNNYYLFDVNGDGSYAAGKMVEGKWSDMITWTVSPYIKQGNDTNKLSVKKVGDRIKLYVNDRYVDETAFEDVFDKKVGFAVFHKMKVEIDHILAKGFAVK